ncbi:MAG: hypothetical protein ACOZQL_10275 [Myxococcota bacterium]
MKIFLPLLVAFAGWFLVAVVVLSSFRPAPPRAVAPHALHLEPRR